MGWKSIVGLFCLLIVGMSPLGHCASLGSEWRPKFEGLLNRNTQESLRGQVGEEKPTLKVQPGKLIIGLNNNAHKDYSDIPASLRSGNGSKSEFQSDQAGWSELHQLQGSVYGFGVADSPAVQQLLGMRPKVDCEEDAMMLKVHGGIGSFAYGLLIDRGSVPPLPFSRVPLDCGLQVQKTMWGSAFVIPYDGCYVAQERDAYILPLRLWGLSAKMSCPLWNLAPSPPSVSCYPNGMVVKAQNVAPVEDLWVKVENDWKPLLKASPKCGFSVVSHSEGAVVSVPYKPCMEAKDGVYSLHMALKNEFKLFCPSLVPSLSLNPSSPGFLNQSGNMNTVSPVKLKPTDASAVPGRRPTALPWFVRPFPSQKPQPFKPDPALGQLVVPYLLPTYAPIPTTPIPMMTTTSAKPPKLNLVPFPHFPVSGYPYYHLKPQTPAPFYEVPVTTPKPKPGPVSQTSTPRPSPQTSKQFSPTKIPGKPRPTPGAAPTHVPASSKVEEPSFVGKTGFYPVVPQVLPGSVFSKEPLLHNPDLQRPGVLPTAVPSTPPGTSKVFGKTGSLYQAVPEKLPGPVFAQRPWWLYSPQHPQRPTSPPTAAPSKPLKASNAVGVAGSPYQAVPQMLPGTVFAQGPELHYPPHLQRPEVLPTAAPVKLLEVSRVSGEAVSSYQAVSQMSRQIGYSECCPSTALYSSCCPPSFSYHQHNHHHFGFPYPVFDHDAVTELARSSTSSVADSRGGFAAQHIVKQTTGKGALPPKDLQQAAAKPTSRPHDMPMKPSVRPQTGLNSFVPMTKHLWAGQVPPMLGSLHKPTATVAFVHQQKSKLGSLPNMSQNSPEYSKPPQMYFVGQTPEEKHHPLPASSQTNSEPFMFLPSESSSQLSYKDPDDFFSRNLYDQSLIYSQAKFPSAVGEPYLFPEPEPHVDHKLLEQKQSLFDFTFGSGPPAALKTHFQEQVPGALGQLSYVPSSDHVTEDLSRSHLQVLTGPFREHWVPVVSPKQREQVEFFDPLSQLSPPDYQPHGPV